jgi:hypothetical protein
MDRRFGYQHDIVFLEKILARANRANCNRNRAIRMISAQTSIEMIFHNPFRHSYLEFSAGRGTPRASKKAISHDK